MAAAPASYQSGGKRIVIDEYPSAKPGKRPHSSFSTARPDFCSRDSRSCSDSASPVKSTSIRTKLISFPAQRCATHSTDPAFSCEILSRGRWRRRELTVPFSVVAPFSPANDARPTEKTNDNRI